MCVSSLERLKPNSPSLESYEFIVIWIMIKATDFSLLLIFNFKQYKNA